MGYSCPQSSLYAHADVPHATTKANNARVLIGTQISCNETADDQDW